MSTEDRKRTAHRALVVRVLEGDGRAPRDQRHAAFDNAGLGEPLHALINKVAEQPARITDQDVAAVKASGLAEDEIFELVVCAAVGQATRQYETALGALAEATDKENDPPRPDPPPPEGRELKETREHAPRDPQ
jgi:alkylhydroperoxidase family enzyme